MSADCQVWVNGVRLADTAAAYESDTPAVLSGLAVAWGRSDSQSQPDAGTATFDLIDRSGGVGFLDLVHVGWPVLVLASATFTDPKPADGVTDPGFTTDPTHRITWTGTGTATDDPPRDALTHPAAGHALRFTNTDLAQAPVNLGVPPAPFTTSPPPNAWADVPVARPGEVWRLTLGILPGLFHAVQARPGYWTTTGPAGPITPLPGAAYIGLPSYPGSDPIYWGSASQNPTITVPAGVPAGARLGWDLRAHPMSFDEVAASYGNITYNDVTGMGSYDEAACVWLDEQHAYQQTGTHGAVVFSGRVTDLDTSRQGAGGGLRVVAAEWPADAANYAIGDTPWVRETCNARVARILALAAADFPLSSRIDTRPGGLRVSWVDVDDQPLWTLLADLATSTDAILWPVDKAGVPGVWFEDIDTRFSTAELTFDSGSGLVVIVGMRPAGGYALSACEIREDIHLVQSVAEVLTRIDLTWLEQTLDEGGAPAPTERTITTVDAPARAQFGDRRMSYSTQLTTSADGTSVANRMLARSRAVAWRAQGLTWDTNLSTLDDSRLATLLALLDAAHRPGATLTITDMPDWAPTGPEFTAFVEGGSYAYTEARWLLTWQLAPSSLGGNSVTYATIDPTWRYNQMDPTISYVDLWGVAP